MKRTITPSARKDSTESWHIHLVHQQCHYIANMPSGLNWQPLQHRRLRTRFITFYKITNNKFRTLTVAFSIIPTQEPENLNLHLYKWWRMSVYNGICCSLFCIPPHILQKKKNNNKDWYKYSFYVYRTISESGTHNLKTVHSLPKSHKCRHLQESPH